MYPPVLIIMSPLHNKFPAYHCKSSLLSLLCTDEAHPYKQSPEALHGDGDVGGDGVCYGEVEHKVVNIGSAPDVRPARLLPGRHQGNGVQDYSH